MIYDRECGGARLADEMDRFRKQYDAFELFENVHQAQDQDMYYEIEYDSSPIPGAGKFVLKSKADEAERHIDAQRIQPQVQDEVREIFDRMRDIARERRSYGYYSSNVFDKRMQQENALIFYEQGMFMKEFEDHYQRKITCSSYFPRYQMMGYEQLRTYFTWRTQVRGGYVERSSVSYAFMYIYELLNQIGVDSSQEGLEQLLFFWKEYRCFDDTLDRYVVKWLKDYHVYYELPHTFREFVKEKHLETYYAELFLGEDAEGETSEGEASERETSGGEALESGSGFMTAEAFERFCSYAKYDIRKSRFYPEHEQMIQECFSVVLQVLRTALEGKGLDLDALLYVPVSSMPVWEPFKGALFHPWMKQRDRRVEITDKEIYVCRENHWYAYRELTTESGRSLLGYVMKQMEAVLRTTLKYKYKLTASDASVNTGLLEKLHRLDLDPECIVTQAVRAYYRERTRIVVKVDQAALSRIRQEAYETQEKLIVEEEAKVPIEEEETKVLSAEKAKMPDMADESEERGPQKAVSEEASMEGIGTEWMAMNVPECEYDDVQELKSVLTSLELQALAVLSETTEGFEQFARRQGVMPQVLMEGINEKAMDIIGDSLCDENFVLYDDYVEMIRELTQE